MDDRSLALHGLAIKRHADAAAVASLTGLPTDVVRQHLADAVAGGRAVEARGACSLTPLARVSLQAGYELHFAPLRADPAFVSAYEGFERANPQVKETITDWQTVVVHGERCANDHTDAAHDERVIDRLAALHERIEPSLRALERALPRLGIYARKLGAALDRAEDGDTAWVSDIHRDSYHTVWFELHEELLRIMARERVE